MLSDLGITHMRLMTNNPAKYGGLEGYGLEITDRVPLDTAANPENVRYLETKRDRLGHSVAQGIGSGGPGSAEETAGGTAS